MNCHTAFHQSLLLIIFLSKQYLHAINIRLKHLRRWRFGTHTFVPSETAAILPALPLLVQVLCGGHTFRNPSHPTHWTWIIILDDIPLSYLALAWPLEQIIRHLVFSEFSTEGFSIPQRSCQRFLKHILLNEQIVPGQILAVLPLWTQPVFIYSCQEKLSETHLIFRSKGHFSKWNVQWGNTHISILFSYISIFYRQMLKAHLNIFS